MLHPWHSNEQYLPRKSTLCVCVLFARLSKEFDNDNKGEKYYRVVEKSMRTTIL